MFFVYYLLIDYTNLNGLKKRDPNDDIQLFFTSEFPKKKLKVIICCLHGRTSGTDFFEGVQYFYFEEGHKKRTLIFHSKLLC